VISGTIASALSWRVLDTPLGTPTAGGLILKENERPDWLPAEQGVCVHEADRGVPCRD